jgi:hypothetical protein
MKDKYVFIFKYVIIYLFLRQKVMKIFCILTKSSNFAAET